MIQVNNVWAIARGSNFQKFVKWRQLEHLPRLNTFFIAKYILHIKQKWFICIFLFTKSSVFLCEKSSVLLRGKITNQHSKFLLYYHMVYCFIRGGIKLQSKQKIVQIWFMNLCMVRSTSLQICQKYLIRWIALSTWLHTAAMVWHYVTSFWESWSFPVKKGGTLRVTTKSSNCFSIVNFLSAITSSSLLQSSLFRVPYLLQFQNQM